ncbi:MAG: double-strand break repair protein AddB [Dinoroseobacter sp.]|nr:double-strand break repair protein AddB [Dinoroseobacter sp.]
MHPLFEPCAKPRVFALPVHADFPKHLVAGLEQRLSKAAPESWARTTVIVNTERMARRLRAILSDGPARFLPKILTVTDIAGPAGLSLGVFGLPKQRPGLRRRLELAQLVEKLLQAEPGLAPMSSAYALADSLAGLLDEMHDEAVQVGVLQKLDLGAHSEHWNRALRFLEIVLPFAEADQSLLDPAARFQLAVDTLIESWTKSAPGDPILLAGSTGSRGTTARLMDAIAKLPQGAVILPGFDFDQPQHIWDQIAASNAGEDHPQERLSQVLQRLEINAGNVHPWDKSISPTTPRSALFSLALRPAPVTDQWRKDGPKLSNLAQACEGMTLVEADTPRGEAAAIAYRLRQALADGQTAALITPDRMLTRQVTAALDLWRITPDDSAGRPLALSAPGRFLRQVSDLTAAQVTSEALIAILKHPLTSTGRSRRGPHLRLTRLFEMWLRKSGPSYPTPALIHKWAKAENDPEAQGWADWVCEVLSSCDAIHAGPLGTILEQTLSLVDLIASGDVTRDDTGQLWLEEAGEKAQNMIAELKEEADAGGTYTPRSFTDLLNAVLQNETVRDAVSSDPRIMIWGTLEARVQGADLVILGGLNEGIWPSQPSPDPWLNRQMRKDAGLTLPDRRIGLQAHDFQQAVAAKTVILTRARRDSDAETVPSRWLNRLTNLLSGIGPQGEDCLAAMRSRGDMLLADVAALERPTKTLTPAPRPEPAPPVLARPTELSFTDVEKLRRDPYHIYAKHVLRLRPLDDLRKAPDARLRGQVLHKVFEVFTRSALDGLPANARDLLMQAADKVLASAEGWTAAERQWRVHIDRIADGFLIAEAQRRKIASPFALEVHGSLKIPGGGRLFGRADRVDVTDTGELVLYDYKSGAPPSPKIIEHYNRQLHLEAAVAEANGFKGVPAATVAEIAFLGLHKDLRTTRVQHNEDPDFVSKSWEAFLALFQRYQKPEKGYLSRRAVKDMAWAGEYDHLARYGEWDDSTSGSPESVT